MLEFINWLYWLYTLYYLSFFQFVTADAESQSRHSDNPSVKNKLILESDPVYLCAKGFVLENDKCVKKQLLTAKFGCKHEGSKFVNESCISFVVKTPRYHCPENLKRINDECIKTTIAPKYAVCPHNYVMSEQKTCVLYEKAEAKPHCKEGETLIKKEETYLCTKLIETSVSRTCPDDYVLSENYICEKKELVEPERSCPEGYTISPHDKMSCLKHEEVQATPLCPEGYTLEYESCRRNDKTEDKYCFQEENSSQKRICLADEVPLYKCPKKFFFIETNKIVPPPFETPYVCIDEDVFPNEHECVTNRQGKECADFLMKTVKIVHPSCPFGYKLNSAYNTCELIQVLEPEPSCILPTKSDSTKCISRKKIDSFETCQDSDCEKEPTTKHIIMGCPDSYELNHDVCEKISISKIKLSCDHSNGYIIGENGSCIRYKYLNSTSSCPLNFELSGDKKKCLTQNFERAEYICPDGFVLKTEESNKIYCIKQSKIGPEIKCPKGYAEVEDGCQRKTKEEAIAVCDKDYDVVLDQCVKEIHENPVIMCPVGTTYRGDTSIDILALNRQNQLCEHIVRMKPTLACPPEFNLIDQTCVKHVKSVGIPVVNTKKPSYPHLQSMYMSPYYYSQKGHNYNTSNRIFPPDYKYDPSNRSFNNRN